MGRWYSALQSIHTKCLPLGLKLQGSGYGAQLVAQGSLGGAAMMATPCAINARQRYSSGNTAGPNSRADRPLRVLGIESSCDDTAAAVVSEDGRILGEAIRHQHKVHEPNGGIVPGLAAEHHLVNMPDVIREALDNSGLEVSDLDAVAVTRGPGLPASLSVCINAAKTLAAVHRKPLIGVHHMEAHALTARMTASVPFPFLCVLISGGHTLSLVVHDVNEYTQLGTTRDDSVGEAFDK
ncbi:Mitochondrial tRNAs modification protein, partial [Spiromyces aspiralis]